MLVGPDRFRVGAFTVYPDGRPSPAASPGSRFCLLPDAPRLAHTADDDTLALHLLWYRRPPGAPVAATDRAGGIAILSIDLATSPDQAAVVRQGIAERTGLAADAIEIVPFPAMSGSVTLSLGGEAGTGELATRVMGNGPARLIGAERATFTIELSPDGAALLAQAIEADLEVLEVRYDLVFEQCIEGARLRVWCDARRALDLLARGAAGGPVPRDDAAAVISAQHAAGFEILSEAALAPERQKALEDLGTRLLAGLISDQLYARPDQLRGYDASLDARLNCTIDEWVPLEGHAVVAGALRIGGTAAARAQRIERIDLDGGFFKTLGVQVVCPVDFAAGPVDLVKITLSYAAGTIERSAQLVFRDAVTVGSFRFDLASPDRTAYDYAVEVYYRSMTEPARFQHTGVTGDLVVLDVGDLGVLRTTVVLGAVPFDLVRTAVVELAYPPRDLAQTFVLDADHRTATWTAVVREAVGPVRHRTSWLLASGERLEGAWAESASPRIVLDPPPLGQAMQIQVVAAGNFAELTQIVVELHAGTEAASDAQLAFTRAGEVQTWRPRSIGGELRYRARLTMVYRDGTSGQLDWVDHTEPVLVVRDALCFEVAIVARFLDLGQSLKLALLQLEPVTPGGNGPAQTFVLRDRLAETTWRFRMDSPERHRYRHQLTLVPPHGDPRVLPWIESEDSVLVLRPLEP